MTYHQPTIDACVSIIGLDESTGLISSIRALPVAGWTREWNGVRGWYYVRGVGEDSWTCERIDNQWDVVRLERFSPVEFCPLLPPPPGKEGG